MTTQVQQASARTGRLAALKQDATDNVRIEKHARPFDDFIRGLLLLAGIVSILTTIGIVLVLGNETLLFIQQRTPEGLPAVDIVEFLTTADWQPGGFKFGIWSLLEATLMTSFVAIMVALPLGLGAAVYLSEYAPMNVRNTLKPILEILAGIPTVVYGYFAVTFMTPLLQAIGGDAVNFYNTLSAGLVMGIMILPTIASMSEDALSAVPRLLREASYGMGATKFETISKVILPAALSGILAALIVGISRAVGETMIVALAAGAGPNFTFPPNFLVGAETITGHIARISGGDLSYNSIDYNSLFALGLALFIFTLGLNMLSRYISNRFREAYQ
ncbi:MAG TPA: phosphate ABC transporter permease subunit PstC [Aggregatilineales bacterium]|nr:phosphate ABC transporter permease subunit PstC [Aggregatilineales bacterium]